MMLSLLNLHTALPFLYVLLDNWLTDLLKGTNLTVVVVQFITDSLGIPPVACPSINGAVDKWGTTPLCGINSLIANFYSDAAVTFFFRDGGPVDNIWRPMEYVGVLMACLGLGLYVLKNFVNQDRLPSVPFVLITGLVRFGIIVPIITVSMVLGRQLAYISSDLALVILQDIAGTTTGYGTVPQLLELLIPGGALFALVTDILLIICLLYLFGLLAVSFMASIMLVCLSPIAIGLMVWDFKNPISAWWAKALAGSLLAPVLASFMISIVIAMNFQIRFNTSPFPNPVSGLIAVLFTVVGLWVANRATHHVIGGSLFSKLGMMAMVIEANNMVGLAQKTGSMFGGKGGGASAGAGAAAGAGAGAGAAAATFAGGGAGSMPATQNGFGQLMQKAAAAGQSVASPIATATGAPGPAGGTGTPGSHGKDGNVGTQGHEGRAGVDGGGVADTSSRSQGIATTLSQDWSGSIPNPGAKGK